MVCSFQEKYKRALADTENLRRRSQKMIEDAKLYGKDFSPFLALTGFYISTGSTTKLGLLTMNKSY